MLGLDVSDGLVEPDMILSNDLINMFYQMGYIGNISLFLQVQEAQDSTNVEQTIHIVV